MRPAATFNIPRSSHADLERLRESYPSLPCFGGSGFGGSGFGDGATATVPRRVYDVEALARSWPSRPVVARSSQQMSLSSLVQAVSLGSAKVPRTVTAALLH
jgi:hypothetical protein